MIKSLVAGMGHEVLEADDGEAGLLAAAENADIDAILLDLLMPRLDGFGALERFQQNGCAVPRIVLTADVQSKSKDRCLELGAVAVLSKPPSEEVLRNVLKAHMRIGAV